MADAAVEILEPHGHRCLISLDAADYEAAVAGGGHDIAVFGPALSPPERDHLQAVAQTSRPDAPVLHVRTAEGASGIARRVQQALEGRGDEPG